MPLSPASNTVAPTLAVGIGDMVSAVTRDLLFQNERMFGLFGERPSMGGTDYVWPVRTAGSTAVEAYSAGQAFPESGNQTWTYARLAYSTGYHRGIFAIDGHMIDAARGPADLFGIIQREGTLIARQIRDLICTTSLGAGAMGIQLALDNAGTYAGINRATTAAWAAEENAQAGASLNLTDLELMLQELTDAERGGMPDIILASPTAETILKRTAAAVGGPSMVMQSAPGGGAVDVDVIGARLGGLSVGGVPVFRMPDLTATVLLFVDRVNSAPGWVRHRATTVKPLGRRQDADEFDISEALLFVVEDPHYSGKITGVA